MVGKTTLKTKIISSLAIFYLITTALFFSLPTYAICEGVGEYTNGDRKYPVGVNQQCTEGSNFEVVVPEILTVQITRPNSWATGNINTLLRNVITVGVFSNNPAGFTASMTTNSTTQDGSALTNVNGSSSSTIPMLTSAWVHDDNNLPSTAFWGYSKNDQSGSGTYNAVALKGTTPTEVSSSNVGASISQDIYFGAMATGDTDSGTYTGTVIISVVSGTITDENDDPNDNPITPTDPATSDDTASTNPVYQEPTPPATEPDRTIYTASTTPAGGTTTTTTIEVNSGDTTDTYADPAGVTTSTINEGTPLATGLAAAAIVSAVAGAAFFVAARHQEVEDDDEY